jgi:hypothetical protein
MTTSSTITCPHCSQSDQTRLASQAGISTPPEPSSAFVTFIKVIRWIFGIAYGLAVLMILGFLIGGLLLGGFATWFGAQSDPYGLGSSLFGLTVIPLLCSGFLLIFLLVLMGAFMIGGPWLIHRGLSQNYRQRYAQWQRAMEKYKTLQYCSRCAGVFLEGQNRIVPLEQMQAFLTEYQTQPPAGPYGV